MSNVQKGDAEQRHDGKRAPALTHGIAFGLGLTTTAPVAAAPAAAEAAPDQECEDGEYNAVRRLNGDTNAVLDTLTTHVFHHHRQVGRVAKARQQLQQRHADRVERRGDRSHLRGCGRIGDDLELERVQCERVELGLEVGGSGLDVQLQWRRGARIGEVRREFFNRAQLVECVGAQ